MSQLTPIPGLPKWITQAGSKDQAKDPTDLSQLLKAKNQADQLAKGMDLNHPKQSSSQVSAAAIERYQSSYQYSQTMSMQIETREGDKVTVDFRQLYAQYQEFNRQQMAEEGPKGVRYFESREALEATAFEERFAFSVEGDLNEDELKAIFDVFEQVDRLANEFFNGDIEKAFQQAVELEIDFGQLKSFNLDLNRSETRATSYQQSAVAQYQDVQKQGAEKAEEYGVDVGDLPPYLQSWQAAIEKLDEQFANAQAMFDEMMAGTLTQRFPEQDSFEGWLDRVKSFHQNLFDLAQKSNETNLNPQESAESDESLADAAKV